MFTFFHRKSKVVVDCFATDAAILEYVPIVKAIKTVPDWWKSLPSQESEEHSVNRLSEMNMKRCEGFIQLYKRGFVIEAWGDFNFTVTPERKYIYNISNGDSPTEHARKQYGKAFENYEHAKLISPWLFKCEKNHYFHFGPMTWALEKYDFTILPGVCDYHYQHATNINVMIPIKEKEYSFIIPAGTPLVHIIPLNDSYDYQIKNHQIGEKEYSDLISKPSKSYSGYRGIRKLTIRTENRKKSKCPFS